MGVFSPFSKCSDSSHDRDRCDMYTRTEYVYIDRVTGNPDPKHFKIRKVETIGTFLIVEVDYPDCQNFEGKKVLVYAGVSEKQLRTERSLDPHFCDTGKHLSPVARFEPTARGWRYARTFCSHAHEK